MQRKVHSVVWVIIAAPRVGFRVLVGQKLERGDYNALTLCFQLCMVFCRLTIFSKSNFTKNSCKNTTRVSKGLDQDQARRFVGPDLGPNCLQKLSTDDTCSQRANGDRESVLHISARLYTCMYIVTYVCYIM